MKFNEFWKTVQPNMIHSDMELARVAWNAAIEAAANIRCDAAGNSSYDVANDAFRHACEAILALRARNPK